MEAISADYTDDDSMEINYEGSIDTEENADISENVENADDASESVENANASESSENNENLKVTKRSKNKKKWRGSIRIGDTQIENISKSKDGTTMSHVMELSSLPESYNSDKLNRHFTHTLQLGIKKIRSDGFGKNVLYIILDSEKELQRAITFLDGYKYLGSVLKATAANYKRCPNFFPKIGFLNLSKKFWFLTSEERVETALFPMYSKRYREQLEVKEHLLGKRCATFESKLYLRNPAFSHFTVSTKPNTNQMCDIEPMVESPLQEGYCNKGIFIIGKNSGDDTPKVGFRIGNYEKKEFEIGPYNHLKELSDNVKSVAKAMERYLLVSKYQPWDPFTEEGVWRSFAVKTTKEGTALINVQMCVDDMEDDEIENVREELINFFTNDEESTCKVTSFYSQKVSKTGLGNFGTMEFIGGQQYLDETILDRTFKVSVNSIHEGNTGVMEILYEKVIDVVMKDSNTTVVNIYCDIGVISAKLIEKGRNVISLEPRPVVAEQARENLGEAATLITGESEKTVEEVLNSIPEGDSVTVVILLLNFGADKIPILDKIGECDKVNRVICVAYLLDNEITLCRNLNKPYKTKDLLAPVKVVSLDSEPYGYKYIGFIELDRWACQDKATTTFNGIAVKKVFRSANGKFIGRVVATAGNRNRSRYSSNERRPRSSRYHSDRSEGFRGRSRGRDDRFRSSGPGPWNPRNRGSPHHPYANMGGPNRYEYSRGPRPSRPNFNSPPLIQTPPVPNNYEEGYERGFMMAMMGGPGGGGRGGGGGGFAPRQNAMPTRLNLNAYRRY